MLQKFKTNNIVYPTLILSEKLKGLANNEIKSKGTNKCLCKILIFYQNPEKSLQLIMKLKETKKVVPVKMEGRGLLKQCLVFLPACYSFSSEDLELMEEFTEKVRQERKLRKSFKNSNKSVSSRRSSKCKPDQDDMVGQYV